MSFIKNNKHMFLFLLFIVFGLGYFATQFIAWPYHVIHVKLDDMIPFVGAFVIPYVIWYLYVPLPMLFTCFSKQKRDFYAMCCILFSGSFLSILIFMIYPTCIDFRPTSFEHNNIFTWVTELLYANDKPRNVCPSMHCYESVAIHIALCKSHLVENRKWIKPVSLITVILICLSTMFIKQHSIVDVFFGVLLVIPTYFLTYKVVMPALDKKKKPLY